MKKIGLKATTVALALGLAVSGMSPAAAAGQLNGGGASFQADFQNKCLTRFNAQTSALRSGITVGYTGGSSGTGRSNLGSGSYKFAGSDSLGIKSGLTAANSVYFPVAAAPLAIIINLNSSAGRKITGLKLDSATLSNILRGNITTWNHADIVALNRGVLLPSTAITVVSRSGSSGSTGNLKGYLAQNNPSHGWTAFDETNSTFATGTTAASSPAMVSAVALASGRIGYADLSDVTTTVVKVSLKNKAGAFVLPSATAAANYIKASGVLTESPNMVDVNGDKITDNGGIYSVDFTRNVTGAYQLSFITYMVGKKGQGDTNADVRVYANYVLNKCAANPSSITATGYTTIGTVLINKAKLQVAKITN